MTVRQASHAGSWYSDDEVTLTRQLDRWLAQVPDEVEGLGKLPIPGARVIIAPHAGYAYSGPCAAYAYKALDLSKAKRIFLIGPSHHHPLPNIALSQQTGYLTPLSRDPLPVDTTLIAHLRTLTPPSDAPNAHFTSMSASIDEAEHSLELHLPYIHHLLRRQLPANTPTASYPPLVPLMVGYTSTALETAFGNILAPYLADESNAFVISSDFCHWGTRFSYTYYVPRAPAPGPVLPLSSAELPQPLLSSADTERKLMSEDDAKRAVDAVAGGQMLRAKERIAKGAGIPAIHESISACDIACMAAIASGRMRSFRDALQRTGNTVCGRHPIGVIMAAMEVVMGGSTIGDEDGSHGAIPSGRFNFVRYERSSDAVAVSDSSVSYVSAFAVL